MWLGELITQRGIGNGMSILIFASVVSRLPVQGGGSSPGRWFKGTVILAHRIAMIAAIVFVESGQRRIPVQFAKRVVGRRMYGGQSTYIPLKVNQSGVIPVIFASSILAFPAFIADGRRPGTACSRSSTTTCSASDDSLFYMAIYTLLIVFFAYFYTAIAFNPPQQADIIRKQGGFIPGSARAADREVPRQGAEPHHAAGLALPDGHRARCRSSCSKCWDIAQFPFGGTALLITVVWRSRR